MEALVDAALKWLARAAGLASVWFLVGGSMILTFLVWLVGGWDEPLQILLILIVIDFILGWVCAYRSCGLSSSIGWKGIRKKAAYLAVVVVAHLFDHILGGQTPLARTIVITLLSLNEALSILEHAGALGVPLPKMLMSRIEKLREELGGLTTPQEDGGVPDGSDTTAG